MKKTLLTLMLLISSMMTAHFVFAAEARYVTSVWAQDTDKEEYTNDGDKDGMSDTTQTARYFTNKESHSVYDAESSSVGTEDPVEMQITFINFINQIAPQFNVTKNALVRSWNYFTGQNDVI